MSHLSILPTVLRDSDLLAACLAELGYTPRRGGYLSDFAGMRQIVELQVAVAEDTALGWQRQPDGTLALVGDLQRLSRSTTIPQLLGAITRSYAARAALLDAAVHIPQAFVTLQP
jgi:hypothetical protein